MSQTEIVASELKGKEVIGPAGRVIGKVNEVNVNTNTWQVSSLKVSLDKNVAEEIGVKKRFGHTEVPLKTSFMGQVGDKILVKASRDELVQYVTDLKVDEATKSIKIPE